MHDWAELSSLVDALLDVPPDSREQLVDKLSAGDPARRLELERLVAELEHESPLLVRPAAERFANLFRDGIARFPDALAERYRLARELGQGGMATVYLARDEKHARDVAIKVVRPEVASALGTDRFLREIEIVAQLHHPHIIPLYDSGEADGSLFYVMPYEAGLSLRQRLTRDGPLPLDDVLLILRDVCDGLAYAHQHGIIHRDIKPDNVLLTGRHAMITDFGVAKAVTDAAAASAPGAAGIILGTPAYMAPEQIAGEAQVDRRADIYSVGVLAYELLAGRVPFNGGAYEDVRAAHLAQIPAPLATYREGVPAPLADLVMRCLEKRPDDRWQSADELLRQLEAVAKSIGIPADQAPAGWKRWLPVAAALAVLAVALPAFVSRREATPESQWRARWATARINRLTDFPGSEVDAALSPDGRYATFLADRDSVFDAFVTRIGSEQFVNLTVGRFPQLFNEDVRNVGFSGDAKHVWVRVADIASPASVSMIPIAGGPAVPVLETAVMAVWSRDGSRLAYHETTPGDPIYVANGDGTNPRRVYIADPGVHDHDIAWSPDGKFLYFSHGLPPDEMDIWRISSTGGAAERITRHNSRVAYPVLLDDRTLFYTATADDGTGPWLHSMDVDERVPHRVSMGVEHYISIAASAEVPGKPRRLVATVSNPSVDLWSVPIADTAVDDDVASRVALPTARSAAPRFDPDSSLWYLASRGGSDGLWHLAKGGATEVWSAARGALVGAAAISPDGKQACFPVRRARHSALVCTAPDGSAARTLAESLDVRGAASWSPDGKWLAVAARQGSSIRLFKIPADGGGPVRLTDSVASNPVWSPDGSYIVYSGTPRARSVPLRAVTPDGRPHPLPGALSVDRVGDSYRFMPGGKALVVKLGGFRRQDLWLFDLATGKTRRLTALRPGESLRRFDVSPDGKRIVLERVQENSDIALIELPIR